MNSDQSKDWPLQVRFEGGGDCCADAVAEGGYIVLRETSGVDGVVEMHGDGGGPEHPVAGAVVLEGADEADRSDGDAELLGEPEAAVLELVDAAIAGAFGFGENDEAGAAVDGVLGEAPHALDVGGTAHVGDGDIAETLHEPAVGGNFEMGFELPAAHELRNRAVEDEGIEDVDVIDHEEAGALRIETGGADDFDAGAGKKGDASAKGALQPVVLAHVQKNIEKNEKRRSDEKMQEAENPENGAAQREVGALHMCTSRAPGRMSSERIARAAISPSIMTLTGEFRLNSTRRTARREASGWWMCVPS